MKKGYVQVYTGNGKGKSTAAFGLALRALYAGMSVFVMQFAKSMKYSETKLVEDFKNIEVYQCGSGCFIFGSPTEDDKLKNKDGLEMAKKAMYSNEYDVIILDELNIAIHYDLVELDEVIEMLENRPKTVEVIITGRYAKEELMNYADLVTEMKEIKHYYKEQKVMSRLGIEK